MIAIWAGKCRYFGISLPKLRWVWLFWGDSGVWGGALVVGVTVVSSEVVRLWLKVAFVRVDGMKATFSHL